MLTYTKTQDIVVYVGPVCCNTLFHCMSLFHHIQVVVCICIKYQIHKAYFGGNKKQQPIVCRLYIYTHVPNLELTPIQCDTISYIRSQSSSMKHDVSVYLHNMFYIIGCISNVFVSLCMYIYICLHIHTYIHTAYIYTLLPVYKYTYIYIHSCVYIYMCI